MAYDIYGNHLKPGYCEVHPDVPEPYPCYRCYQEREEEDDYYRYLEEQAEEEYSRWLEEEELWQPEERAEVDKDA